MGPKFTEGAIVQHLSKLRLRREGAGQRVPPPLRRSVTAAAAAAAGGKGTLKPGKNPHKRKGRADVVDDDFSDGLDAQEEDESDPEYIQNKKKHKSRRFSFSTSKKSSKRMEDDDDDDALMCGGAPFLQHTEADIESDQYESDDDEDAAHDADNDYDSDSFRAAKLKLEQDSPTPRQSRVVKLPITLGNRGQGAMKSIRGLADPTPPPPAMGRSLNQNFFKNDPAMMSNNPNSMFVPQGNWDPSQMPTSQAPENMYQSAHMFWPQPTPVVNNQMLQPGDFIWSQHAPAFATGRGGRLGVPGLPASTWDSSSTTVEAPSAPSMTMNPSDWFINSNLFNQEDDDEVQADFKKLDGDEEY